MTTTTTTNNSAPTTNVRKLAGEKSAATKVAKRTKAANVAGAAAVRATLCAVTAWGKADAGAEGALVAVFRAAAHGGLVTPEMIGKGAPHISASSRPVYASTFNKAAKVAGILGVERTIALIDKAASMPGKKWERVRDALGAVQTDAKAAGVTLATDQQAGNFAAAAVLALSVKDDAEAARKASAKKERAPQAPTLPAVPPVTGIAEVPRKAAHLQAALATMAADVSRWIVPENRKGAQRAIVSKLQDAIEEATKLLK